jgi:hypothetical protein
MVAGAVNGGGIYSSGQAVAAYFNYNTTANNSQLLIGTIVADPVPQETAAPQQHPAPLMSSSDHVNPELVPAICSASYLDPTPCELFESVVGQYVSTAITRGELVCDFAAQISSHCSAGHWYAFVAVDQVLAAPHTPDPIHLQACIVLSCTDVTPVHGANVSCSESFFAYTSFQSFSLAGNFSSDVDVFPYLSLDLVCILSLSILSFSYSPRFQGELTSNSQTTFTAAVNPVVFASSTEWSNNNIILSASLYGLAPLP